MRKMLGTTAILILLSTVISAQTSVSRTYIKGGKDAYTNFLKEIYLNPSFESGIVEYKNGKTYKSTLNYNKALGAIQFIDEKGDTLVLNNDDKSVSTVSIGKSVFYMEPVCIQKIAGNNRIILGKNERAKQTDQHKVGALGIPSNAGTIDSYDRSYSRNNHFIDINEELLIRKTTTYYMADEEGNFVPASKKNVLRLFRTSQKDINRFIQAKAIDFNVEADLVELTEYLTTL